MVSAWDVEEGARPPRLGRSCGWFNRRGSHARHWTTRPVGEHPVAQGSGESSIRIERSKPNLVARALPVELTWESMSQTVPAPRFGTTLGKLVVACYVAAFVLMNLHPEHETDSFWHMMLGRAVLRSGATTVTEPTALNVFSDPAIVPEWLWGVTSHWGYQLGGFVLLTTVVALMAGAIALLVVSLVRHCQSDLPFAAGLFVAVLAMCVISTRVRVRPQTAGLLLAAAVMRLSYGYRAAAGTKAWIVACGLALLAVIWAQIHGSFVLAPAIVGIIVAPDLFRELAPGPDPRRRLRHGLLLLALLLALASSAYGWGVVDYLLEHATGYSKAHITELLPSTWASFDPSRQIFGAIYLLMWIMVAAGSLVEKRLHWPELALALLGVALLATAVRFLGLAALLLVPLAARAAAPLAKGPCRTGPAQAGVALIAAGALVLTARTMHHDFGPLLRAGLARSGYPELASGWLRTLPQGSAVLSDFDVGAPIGFWHDGRVRTYVDSRTPLYFKDVDYAVSRDVWKRPELLARALVRFKAQALVMAREPSCADAKLPAGWVLVAVDPRFSTFARAKQGQRPLRVVKHCGKYLPSDPCAGAGAELDADIGQLRKLGASAMIDYLSAARIVFCGGGGAAAQEHLSRARHAWYLRYAADDLEARWLIKQQRIVEGIDLVAERIERGDPEALVAVWPQLVERRELSLSRRRALLEAFVMAADDEAPRGVRAGLAHVCTRLKDARCAMFHGLRAAAQGSPRVLPVLRWLMKHHPEQRARASAKAWLELMKNEQTTKPTQ